MKLIMYMAITANGYTARPDGTEEFLAPENWDSMVELAKKHGNLLVGRKTYEINQTWPDPDNLRNLKTIKKVVVSNDPDFVVAEGFSAVTSPEEALVELKNSEVAYLIGGGTLNASFAAKGLIDEMFLNVDPTIIGKGKPVFAEDDFEMRLELLSTKQVTKNLIQLHYRVRR